MTWHDALSVAEQAAILDQVSGGPSRFRIGRGLSRCEFGHFRGPISMDESRERFDEAAPLILNALKTSFIEGQGKFYKQRRTRSALAGKELREPHRYGSVERGFG